MMYCTWLLLRVEMRRGGDTLILTIQYEVLIEGTGFIGQ